MQIISFITVRGFLVRDSLAWIVNVEDKNRRRLFIPVLSLLLFDRSEFSLGFSWIIKFILSNVLLVIAQWAIFDIYFFVLL